MEMENNKRKVGYTNAARGTRVQRGRQERNAETRIESENTRTMREA